MFVPSASPSSGRSLHLGVVGLMVLVFGAAVAVITFQLREGLRAQILRAAADNLADVSTMQLDNAPDPDVPGALLFAVLKISKFPGVAGVRVYDANQQL